MLSVRAFGSASRRLAGCPGGVGGVSQSAEHLLSDCLGPRRSNPGDPAATAGNPTRAGHRLFGLSSALTLFGCAQLELARFSRKLAPDFFAIGRFSTRHHGIGPAGWASASSYGLGSTVRSGGGSWSDRPLFRYPHSLPIPLSPPVSPQFTCVV